MKSLVIVAVAVAFAATSRVYANAAISLAADDSTFFGDPSSNPAQGGDAVYMGQFGLSDSSIAALTTAGGTSISPANYATLVASFTALNGVGMLPMGSGESGNQQAGFITGSWDGNNLAFASGNIYVLVVNGASTASPGGEVGVFRGDSSWVYPADMLAGTGSIDTDNAFTALVGSYVTGLNGSLSATWPYNQGDGNDNNPLNVLDMATIVPEPSSILLVAMGLLGGIGMIRRRRS
ncbi:MAG: PEP-CTERM sorting domain-containing protein [Verrucomicrobiia bacterium]